MQLSISKSTFFVLVVESSLRINNDYFLLSPFFVLVCVLPCPVLPPPSVSVWTHAAAAVCVSSENKLTLHGFVLHWSNMLKAWWWHIPVFVGLLLSGFLWSTLLGTAEITHLMVIAQ